MRSVTLHFPKLNQIHQQSRQYEESPGIGQQYQLDAPASGFCAVDIRTCLGHVPGSIIMLPHERPPAALLLYGGQVRTESFRVKANDAESRRCDEALWLTS